MLPISKVVVMEDRAQIERAGEVQLDGETTIEVAGIAIAAVDRSLKVEVRGGTLLEAKLVRRWKEVPRGGLPADASALRKRVEELRLQVAAQNDVATQFTLRAEMLHGARDALLKSIGEQTGFGTPQLDAWKDQLAELSRRQQTLDQERFASRETLSTLQVRLQEVQRALSAEQPEKKQECVLVLRMTGNGVAKVRASYLTPCAVWRPAYRATLAEGQVTLEAEGVVWQHTGEDWENVELLFSTARPTLGTTPPTLEEDIISLRPKESHEKRVVDVSIREEVIQSAGEASAEIPGLDDGGETRLLQATGRVTVKNDGQPQRVALFSFTAPARVERVCPAELSSLVFVLARFANTSPQVLLAGPVDLIRGSGLVGRGLLKFAAPGETLKLSFGSEDGLQIIRETEEKVDEAMLTRRRTTTRKVKLHVSNMRNDGAKLIIEERIPVSEVKEVEIAVLTKDCSPTPATVTKDGIARIEVELGAQSTKTARFSWELSAASKVAGV